MIDAVVTYHDNPLTCGVARFNTELARRLGVPLVPLVALPHCRYKEPLVSLKWGELPADVQNATRRWTVPTGARFLWHDAERVVPWQRGHRVQWASEVGIPALVRTGIALSEHPRWFSLGMSHKMSPVQYALAAEFRRPGSIWLSAWLHEGTSWADMSPTLEHLERIAPTTFLGSLTDAALAWVWPQIDVFVAFFPNGLQANHTSVHAALDAGKPVLTNWGALTPDDLKIMTVDINSISAWPETWPSGPSPYTWERVMRSLCAR